MNIKDYLSPSYYLMIFIDSAEESKMENLIKEKQKFFEKIDNSIRINYFIRNESEKEISKFYIKICHSEFASLLLYILFSVIIFTNYIMVGGIFLLLIVLILRYSYLDIINKITSSTLMLFITERIKSKNIDNFEIYKVKKPKKEIIKHFC
jgi:hypothetical protein